MGSLEGELYKCPGVGTTCCHKNTTLQGIKEEEDPSPVWNGGWSGRVLCPSYSFRYAAFDMDDGGLGKA